MVNKIISAVESSGDQGMSVILLVDCFKQLGQENAGEQDYHPNGYVKKYYLRTPELEMADFLWPESTYSPIHPHGPDAKTQGVALVYDGKILNTTYTQVENGSPVELSSIEYTKGELIYFPRGVIHKMENTGIDIARTFHLYSPAIQSVNTNYTYSEMNFLN